jgi:hypothetical protein
MLRFTAVSFVMDYKSTFVKRQGKKKAELAKSPAKAPDYHQ